MRNITAKVWQEEDAYVSRCPELEIASAGDTAQEALDNLRRLSCILKTPGPWLIKDQN